MESHHKRMIEIFASIGGGSISWMTAHAHDIMGAVAFWGGGIVVILSGISLVWDLVNKWRHRKD